MHTIAEALAAILEPVAPLEAVREPLEAAAGRVAAEDAAAAVDLPPFDRSAMDGYAVRAADTAPGVALRLAGGVAAGEVSAEELAAGTAAAISTGAALPPGADAILQSELASVDGGTVTPERAVEAGRHVRFRGEDVRAGDVLARAGERLTVPRLSALASAGVGEVAVHRRPRLHLLVTGRSCCRSARRPSPGASTSPTG
jgi:molybdopterin molybdotransferase